MTADVSLCNRALSEIGARATITSLSDSSSAGVQCTIWYDALREQLLRAAPWGFARKQLALTETGNFNDQNVPYPWLYKYEYPADCLKVRYLLWPPQDSTGGNSVPQTGNGLAWGPWYAPSRNNRFIVADDAGTRVILSNVPGAICVYVANVSDVSLFDPLFQQALVSALASKLVIPITGNVKMKVVHENSAMRAIANALAADGNEAMPTTDHIPDWIAARGYGTTWCDPFWGNLGSWNNGFDSMSWGS